MLFSLPESVRIDPATGGAQFQREGQGVESWTTRGIRLAPYHHGELPNGMDDNGNGLIDERGLAFVVHDDHCIHVLVTLERELKGETLQACAGTWVEVPRY